MRDACVFAALANYHLYEHLHEFAVQRCSNVLGDQDVAICTSVIVPFNEIHGTKINTKAHKTDKFRSNLCINRCSLKVSSANSLEFN